MAATSAMVGTLMSASLISIGVYLPDHDLVLKVLKVKDARNKALGIRIGVPGLKKILEVSPFKKDDEVLRLLLRLLCLERTISHLVKKSVCMYDG